jgi:hypothetical protein
MYLSKVQYLMTVGGSGKPGHEMPLPDLSALIGRLLPNKRTARRCVTSRADWPGLDVGRYFTFIPRDGLSGEAKEVAGSLWLSGALCRLRKALFRFSRPKDKIWIISDEQDMADCCVEMERLLREKALPWFDWLGRNQLVLPLPSDTLERIRQVADLAVGNLA